MVTHNNTNGRAPSPPSEHVTPAARHFGETGEADRRRRSLPKPAVTPGSLAGRRYLRMGEKKKPNNNISRTVTQRNAVPGLPECTVPSGVSSQFFRGSPAVGSCDGGESRGTSCTDSKGEAKQKLQVPGRRPNSFKINNHPALYNPVTHHSRRHHRRTGEGGAVDHLTEVTGPPGDDDGVRLGVRLVHKLHLHVIGRVDVMLADLGVFPAQQIQTRPRDAAWGEDKRKRSTYWQHLQSNVLECTNGLGGNISSLSSLSLC